VICTAIVGSGFVARVHAAAVRDSAAASWPFAAALGPGADELAGEIGAKAFARDLAWTRALS
jgi:hypothetical protein